MSEKKTKILIINDINDRDVYWTDPEFQEIMNGLGDDVEFDVAQDTNYRNFVNLSEYVLYMERNGPEWITPDPEILEKVKDADILVDNMSGISSKIIDAGKNLKFIGNMRSGFENVNVEYAESKGIIVRNCPGRLADPVADLTLAMILSETRGILRGNLVTNHGKWERLDEYRDSSQRAMSVLKVGIVGFGQIGPKLARRLLACDATVYAYDPYVPEEKFKEHGVIRFENMNDMIPKCDVVCMMARLTEDSKGIFGEEQFALMKPTAIFCNTARAGLVDEDAMVRALKEKRIRGACLDTYSIEPLPADHPLIGMRNVTLMPHRCGSTMGMEQNAMRMMFKTLRRYLDGEEV